ncbi:hypothetical protein L0Y40_02865 [Candidatus Wolfebacteria bacterium]|nr:hypothetical protein [Candidatus Wolfebacteria bacterium]
MRVIKFVLAALIMAVSTPAALGVDYVIEEDPAFVPEGLRSMSMGATQGPGGVYYFPLRVHCAFNLPVADCQGYYNLMQAKLNVPFEVSGIDARFVLEGPFPSPVVSVGSLLSVYNAYKAWYPADGRFGMLLVPTGDGTANGLAGVTNPVPGVLLRSAVSIENWVFAGRPLLGVEFVEIPAHETGGHNLGLLHDGECPLPHNMDGCGYVNSQGIGDIMSANGIYRETRFSDPTVMVEGEPFGSASANAVRFVNSRLADYAAVTAPVVVPCVAPPDDVAHLQGGRFEVSVCWRTSQGTSGPARLLFITPESAFFWFFNEGNIELILKVKNACVEPFNRFWFFAAGLTNVEVTMTVLDDHTDTVKTYQNPLNTAFQPIQDTSAFDTCP